VESCAHAVLRLARRDAFDTASRPVAMCRPWAGRRLSDGWNAGSKAMLTKKYSKISAHARTVMPPFDVRRPEPHAATAMVLPNGDAIGRGRGGAGSYRAMSAISGPLGTSAIVYPSML
jgi:hypothetical protein